MFYSERLEQSLKYEMSASPTAFVTPAATTDFAPHPMTGTKSRNECATLLPMSGAAIVASSHQIMRTWNPSHTCKSQSPFIDSRTCLFSCLSFVVCCHNGHPFFCLSYLKKLLRFTNSSLG